MTLSVVKKVYRREDSPTLKEDRDRLMHYLHLKYTATRDSLPRTAASLDGIIQILSDRIATHDYQTEDQLFSLTHEKPPVKDVLRMSYSEIWNKAFAAWDNAISKQNKI